MIEYIHPDTPGKREALERCPHIPRRGIDTAAVECRQLDYYNRGAKRY